MFNHRPVVTILGHTFIWPYFGRDSPNVLFCLRGRQATLNVFRSGIRVLIFAARGTRKMGKNYTYLFA